MRTPNPAITLAAFGLNVVDEYATAYEGWSITPLNACVNDAAAWTALAALSHLSGTMYASSYVGQLSGIGPSIPPYRLALDCTRELVRSQIALRAGYVTQAMKGGAKAPLTVLCISGHGAQEEYIAETVESLVLSDGLMPDTEFHNLLALFPPGARVAVFLDTCHSGGMDRSASFRFRAKFAGRVTRDERYQRSIFATPSGGEIVADVAVFAACDKNTTALDGQYNGAFTGSYMRAANEALNANQRPSWLDVFHQCATYCVRDFKQLPVVTYHGDQSVWQQPFFK